MDLVAQILAELQPLVLNGLWVSIICTVLFMVFRFPDKWGAKLKKILMQVIIFVVALGWALLVASNPEWQFKEKLVLWIKIVAFSFLFYEIAGQYIVKRLFEGYRINSQKKIEE